MSTVTHEPISVQIPDDKLKAIRKLIKSYRYRKHFEIESGFSRTLVNSLLTGNTCKPSTLERIEELLTAKGLA